ncbi:protein CUSTOS [Vanacampus margaritifer]
MAGKAVKKMVGSARDSSSSDDEVLKRCQEAVWDARKSVTNGNGSTNQSKRVVVADHEHDGNELQVTQGFQTHVAKKLGQFLDSRLTEIQTDISICKTQEKCEDDEGFLLFSTSVPGQPADDPPPAVKRRPIPSSSESDSEMETRLKEAAVSLKDLLPSSSLTSSQTASAPLRSEKKKKKSSETEEETVAKKKKKKKKRKREWAEDAGSKHADCEGSSCAHNNGENAGSKQEQHKVKRKKKVAECD